ncbi:MAG: glycine--tRNA ligase subunit beta, partial [Firmicutes bacterium]|nr:glycine--tRNA ligase subunit beta [Bacillota bacterium]
EIGCEEIPARLMPDTLNQLKELATDKFQVMRLSYTDIETLGTPRRLVLVVSNLAEETASYEYEVKGPPAKVAYDAAGQPTRAAQGFAKSQGVELSALTVRTVEGGEYVFATKREHGRPVQQVLTEVLPALVRALAFPRPMRWGNREIKFVRPIRWLLALFGSEAIPFELEGIKSDRYTFGHRFLAPGPFAVSDLAEYLDCLKNAYVMLSPQERQSVIKAQGEDLAKEVGGRVLWTEDLLTEVTFLVEYPTALIGSFDPEYLVLPSDVIVTPMKDHQRYFPVVNQEGELLPYFIAVRNGTADHLDVVRIGNENVLKARLADARFFFEEDQKATLAERVQRLQHIVFQENLGTLYDKTERIMALAKFLAEQVGLDEMATSFVQRAAFLAKADLTTNMVNEFPELQGVMGREYALLSGEHASVAQAIAEQYLPRFAGDELPATLSGALLALSDKMDTIVGSFGAGLIPTGSEDPYGLRRLATGCINIILDQELDLSLSQLAAYAASLYEKQKLLPQSAAQVAAEVQDFLTQRLRIVLEDRGFRYDVVDAVLAVLPEYPSQAYRRAEVISRLRKEPFFADMLQALIRVGNLARQAEDNEPQPELFTEAAEWELYQHYLELKDSILLLVKQERGQEALEQLSTLAPPVDRFFTDVLVMAEDPAVRSNRLALLKAVRDLALSVADFSRLVPDN